MIVIDCLIGHATRAEATRAFPRIARSLAHRSAFPQGDEWGEMSIPMCRFARRPFFSLSLCSHLPLVATGLLRLPVAVGEEGGAVRKLGDNTMQAGRAGEGIRCWAWG